MMTRSAGTSRSWKPTASITTWAPGRKAGARERQQSEPQSPRRAGTGVAGSIDPQVVRGHGGQMSQRPIQQHHLIGPGALLGPEDRAGPRGPAQRVIHVGDGHDLHRPDRVQNGAHVDRRQLEQSLTPVRDRMSSPVEESPPEGHRHADAAVGARGSPEAHQQAGHALAEDRGHQLPRAPRRRADGVAMLDGQQPDAGGPSHLDDADAVSDARLRLHLAPKRSGDGTPETPARLRGHERVQGPLSSVGQREQIDEILGPLAAPTRLDRLGGLPSRQRAAELVGRNQDAHGRDCTIPPEPTGKARAT